MFLLKTLPILAVAGSALAAPVAQEQENDLQKRWDWRNGWSKGQWDHGSWGGSSSVEAEAVETDVVVVTATAYVTAAAPAETTTPVETTPAVTSVAAPAWTPPAWTPPAPAPTTTEAPAPPPPAAPTQAPATSWAMPAAPAASDSWSAPSTDTGYMATVSKWRSAFGLPGLTQDSKLEANALKTATDSGGSLTHELNPGTMAQVLAPGNANNFESVYVGGWLCEVPSAAALAGVCASASGGWDHSNGETGHYDILTSTSYSKIGCSLADGIWACDLA